MKNRLVILIAMCSIYAFGFSACVEDVDSNNDINIKSVAWNKIGDSNSNIFNSIYANGKINLISGEKLYFNLGLNGLNGNEFDFKNFQSRPGWFKMPVSENFLVTRTDLDIFLFAINSSNVSDPIKITPKDFDPTFLRFEDTPFWEGVDAFGLTNNGFVLLPYRSAVNGIVNDNPSFLLLSLAKENENVVLKNTKIVNTNALSYYDASSIVKAFGNVFYAKLGNSLLMIDTNGIVTVEANVERIKIINSNNKFKGIGYNPLKKESVIFEANLDGSNFKTVNKHITDEDFVTEYNYVSINDRVIAFKGDQVYELVNLNSKPTLKELNNKGLEGANISSMFLTENNDVVLTNKCNAAKCGIFSKPLASFFDYKKVD